MIPLAKQWKRTGISLLAAGFVLSSVSAGLAAAQGAAGANASYTAPTMHNSANTVPLKAPVWTADIGIPAADNWKLPSVTVANGNVYYVRSGVLTAKSVSSGMTLWTYGSKLSSDKLQVAGDSLYAVDEAGAVYRVNGKTGKGTRWYQLKDASGKKTQWIWGVQASPSEGVLYVTSMTSVVAVELTSGATKWRNDSFYFTSAPQKVGDKLLMYAEESGAITVGTTYAIDPKTGKTLWRLEGSHSKLVHADGDKLYFDDRWPTRANVTSAVRLDVVSPETGEVTETLPLIAIQNEDDFLYLTGRQFAIDGSDIYVGMNGGGGVYRYGLHANPKVIKPQLITGNGKWIAGPYNGKLFFESSDRMGIYGAKIFDHTTVYYEGLDNPVSRMDLIDSGMYVGQTDGAVYALNVMTGKALFRYETGARNYGPFQTAGDKLLVQAEGKLYAFALPAGLTKPLPAESDVSDAFAKAQAKLTINGVAREFEPSMMTSSNRMFVPFRFLTEAVGAKVAYDSKTKKATVTYGERTFTIAENMPYAETADGQHMLSFAPAVIKGSLYVPVKDIGELLGINVSWNASTRTVEVVTRKS